MNKTFSRRELYDLLWSEPILSIAKTYIVSDWGLRKLCKEMNIPLPKAGHWEKVRFGKKVTIVDLPPEASKQEVTFTLREEGAVVHHIASPVGLLQLDIEKDTSLPLTVHATVSNPDKLIVAAQKILSIEKEKDYHRNGLLSCAFYGGIDIHVAPKNVGRALRFMDAFIKLLRARGHGIEVANRATHAIVFEQKIEISLNEKLKKTIVKRHAWDSTEYSPTGILSFKTKYYHESETNDGKRPIEEQLSRILAKLEILANELKKERQEMEKWREEQAVKERIKLELQRIRDKELADFTLLLQKSTRWQKANVMRNYITQIEASAEASNSLNEELKAWVDWARKKADWYDPLIELRDEALLGIDKETLTQKR